MDASDPRGSLSRRRVLRLASLAAGSAALSAACGSKASGGSPAAATAASAPASSAGVSRVVLIRSDGRVAGTRAAIDLLQPTGLKGRSVFLKPNSNTADPAPGAITVGDRSGMADTRRAMETKGVFALADRLGLQALVLDELDRDGWQYVAAVADQIEIVTADAAGRSLADDLRRLIAA